VHASVVEPEVELSVFFLAGLRWNPWAQGSL